MRIRKQKPVVVVPKNAGKNKRKHERRFKRLPLAGLVLVVVVAICWSLIAFSNSSINTTTKTLSVPGLPANMEGYTILQLTDLNSAEFGANQEDLAAAIKAVNYDVICMTGDMIGSGGNAQPLLDLIDALDTKKPIMFITGDSDPDPITDTLNSEGNLYADYILELQARGVTYLDSPAKLSVGSSNIWFSSSLHLNINTADNLSAFETLYNAAQSSGTASSPELAYDAYRLDCAQKLNAAAKSMQSTDVHISLCHVPLSDDFVRSLQYAEGDITADTSADNTLATQYLKLIDLALCGHYVGGQWRVPVYGALFVPDERLGNDGWLPQQDQVAGLRRSNSVYIFTGTGLSSSSAYNLPPFRVFNSPEIAVIKLTSQLGVQ